MNNKIVVGSWLTEHVCPICGKSFVPTDVWVFRRGNCEFWCSWSCYKKRLKPKNEYLPKKHFDKRSLKKMYKLLLEDVPPKQISVKTGIPMDSIHYYRTRYKDKGIMPAWYKEK